MQAAPGPMTGRESFLGRLSSGDEAAHLITFLAAASIILVTGWIVFELFRNSALSRARIRLAFLITQKWDPVAGQFGALPFIYGTVVTSALALLIAVPLGVGAAIFLAELAPPRMSDALTFLIELLAAVPSVIYGLLASLFWSPC